ncbi:hypothetical protein RR48_05560 [Papilio machaon]|uniref:Monocarboxylate transporter n=1 Tax=Papilio machaon TaxID=76193 RepID=A0A0N0PDF2_PAPMA|nr:hypothetical protein RR48_05560 [Papilio machaon]
MSLTFFSDLTFFTLEPLFLDKNHLDRGQIANIIATGGATDMSARLLLGVSGQFFRMNSRYMFYVGALLTAIFRIVFIQYTSYVPLLVLTGILGAIRSLLHIAQPIVMAEHVPIERYPPAYGLYMLLAGGISLTIGPMIDKKDRQQRLWINIGSSTPRPPGTSPLRDRRGIHSTPMEQNKDIKFVCKTLCHSCLHEWTVRGVLDVRKDFHSPSIRTPRSEWTASPLVEAPCNEAAVREHRSNREEGQYRVDE